MLAYMVVTIFFVSPVSAKVIRLDDLQNFLLMGSVGSSGGDGSGCDGMNGEYSTPPPGKNCTYNSVSKCYEDCKCSESLFPFDAADCVEPVFKPGGSVCQEDDGTIYYGSCECGEEMVKDAPSQDHTSAFVTGEGSTITPRQGSPLTCYNPADYFCKEDYPQISIGDVDISASIQKSESKTEIQAKSEPVIYTAITNYPFNSHKDTEHFKACAFSIKEFFEGIKSTNSNNMKCAKMVSKTTKYLNKTYYYYDGTCSENVGCSPSSVGVCVAIAADIENEYDPETNKVLPKKTLCNYVSGCNTGIISDLTADRGEVLCLVEGGVSGVNTTSMVNGVLVEPTVKATPASSLAGVESSYYNSGLSKACIRVTGCADDYEEYKFESVTTSGEDYSTYLNHLKNPPSVNTTIYTVQGHRSDVSRSNKYGYIICTKKTGCRINENSVSTNKIVCNYNTARASWKKFMNSIKGSCVE